ncbi:MAG: glycosyltransferase, partial [Sphingomonadales bacterium]
MGFEANVMNIVMLCDFFQDDLEYQENLLVDYYVKAGHQVTVICSLYDNVFDYYNDVPVKGPKQDYQYAGARIIKLPYRYNILHRVRAYPKIDSILNEAKPDLIYVHDIMLNFPECIAYVKRHPQTRMIMDYHADYSNSGKNWVSIKLLHGVIRKRFLDRARPYLQRIFPVVPGGAEFLNEVYGVPMADMEVLPLGTDLDVGRAIHATGARARLLAIFTGGKLDPLKKTEHLIAAFNSIGRDDLHLIIIGQAGKGNEAYKELLDKTAAGNPRIHFRGWQDKTGVYEHLDAADLAIFPASQSVLWQQAIGMNLPLIVGDRSELVRGHQDARYLNCHDNMIILDPSRRLYECSASECGPSDPTDALAWLGLVLLAVIAILPLVLLRRAPIAAAGIAWWCVFFFPVANLLNPATLVYGERLLYLPMIGAVLCVVDLTRRTIARVPRLAAASLLLVAFAAGNALAIQVRHGDWRSNTT